MTLLQIIVSTPPVTTHVIYKPRTQQSEDTLEYSRLRKRIGYDQDNRNIAIKDVTQLRLFLGGSTLLSSLNSSERKRPLMSLHCAECWVTSAGAALSAEFPFTDAWIKHIILMSQSWKCQPDSPTMWSGYKPPWHPGGLQSNSYTSRVFPSLSRPNAPSCTVRGLSLPFAFSNRLPPRGHNRTILPIKPTCCHSPYTYCILQVYNTPLVIVPWREANRLQNHRLDEPRCHIIYNN